MLLIAYEGICVSKSLHRFDRRELKTLADALYEAADWEQSIMDAYRDRYSAEWKPMKGGSAVYKRSEKRRKSFLELRSKVVEILLRREK